MCPLTLGVSLREMAERGRGLAALLVVAVLAGWIGGCGDSEKHARGTRARGGEPTVANRETTLVRAVQRFEHAADVWYSPLPESEDLDDYAEGVFEVRKALGILQVDIDASDTPIRDADTALALRAAMRELEEDLQADLKAANAERYLRLERIDRPVDRRLRSLRRMLERVARAT